MAAKSDIIFHAGCNICLTYNGFTISEKDYCSKRSNWIWLDQFIESDGPFTVMLLFRMSPVFTVVGCIQYIISSIIDCPDIEQENLRIKNLLEIIDNHDDLEQMVCNTKVIRALLAIASAYKRKNILNLGINSCKILSHIAKRHPCILDMNVNLTKGRFRQRRFTKEDVDKYF